MATRTIRSAEELARVWKARQAFLERRAIPQTFNGFMGRVHGLNLAALQRMVYATAKPYRSGHLAGWEFLHFTGSLSAEIVNTASYALYVHEGTKRHTAPTSGGKQYWAWVDPPRQRPASHDAAAWREGLQQGWAHRTRTFKARRPRRWRREALKDARRELKPWIRRMKVKFHAQGP